MKNKVAHESGRVFFFEVSENQQNTRLDLFLTSCSLELSRSRIQALIKGGYIKVNAGPTKASHKLRPGDRISVRVPPPLPEILEPEPVQFGIVHEDEAIIVVDKPAGLVVHPAPGHPTGTLVHGLINHCPDLSGIGGIKRPGVVHRLDKDTSGLMVVAKSDRAHACLARQFKAGAVRKQYLAIVHGATAEKEGRISLPISRHPKKRKQMSVAPTGGREALTLWNKLEEFRCGFSLLSVSLKTGRTHQIRVHLSHIGHPVLGDVVYGYRRNWWKSHPIVKETLLRHVKRQMLHAACLGFVHPASNQYMEFESALPQDMMNTLQALKQLELKRS